MEIKANLAQLKLDLGLSWAICLCLTSVHWLLNVIGFVVKDSYVIINGLYFKLNLISSS